MVIIYPILFYTLWGYLNNITNIQIVKLSCISYVVYRIVKKEGKKKEARMKYSDKQ